MKASNNAQYTGLLLSRTCVDPRAVQTKDYEATKKQGRDVMCTTRVMSSLTADATGPIPVTWRGAVVDEFQTKRAECNDTTILSLYMAKISGREGQRQSMKRNHLDSNKCR
eukprot:11761382-Karenia_brevis.AAC.1